ncbi:hypothetical protein IWW37_000486 [Coemansia sp. RSA 2050]|nr:hypothetical protein IWW37_000486 [Coemansia sp. RSA 2050]KAJ2734303.1 hypothetical protein IW152_002434 [Coemansia sp. BCRC 34962]
MRHNEGFDRSYSENLDSGHYGFVTDQPGNEVGQQQQSQQQQSQQQHTYSQQYVHEQQYAYSQHNLQNQPNTYSQPIVQNLQHGYGQQHGYSQPIVQNQQHGYGEQHIQNPQQSFNTDYKPGPGYPDQPYSQGFEYPPVSGPAWNSNMKGRADELDEGYGSAYDSATEYGGERGFGEVKDKFMGKFVNEDEYGNKVYDKTNIALAAAAVVAVAVGTAAVVKNGIDVKRAKDDEQRDNQIGGGSQFNDTHNSYPPVNAPYNAGFTAHPNDSGYFGGS